MSDVIVNVLVTTASSAICSMIAWFLARKKYHSEVDHNLIQNMQESLEFYKKLSDDNRERLEEVLKRNDALEEEVKELKSAMFNWMANLCYDLTCGHRVRQDLFKNSVISKTDNGTSIKQKV